MPGARRGPAPAANRGPGGERDHSRRTLSQNFLRGQGAVAEFLSMVELEPDDLVVEVGAGDGAITEAIAPRCREVVAYEIDPHHLPRLAERVGHFDNVHIVPGDFLAARPPGQRFDVVGNVPFAITSQVVSWCMRARTLAAATIITQLEYAKKRTGEYGRWSLLTVESWPWFSWELRGRIARDRFRPVPGVDAGVLHLARRDRPFVRSARASEYRRMVEAGFGGVGGSLYRSLHRRYPPGAVGEAFRAAGLDRDVVVAYVSPEQWLRIFGVISPDGE
jgi:23S rRNA (adenine-N6)-dimethyltransferase